MLEKAKEIVVLLQKHMKGELSADERVLLDQWASRSEHNRKVLAELEDEGKFGAELKMLMEQNAITDKQLYDRFKNTLPAEELKVQSRKQWINWAVAAGTILCISLLSYFLLNKQENAGTQQIDTATANDIRPGKFKARLTLADGRTIALDTVESTGELAKQDNAVITNREGQLVYALKGNKAVGEKLLLNTLVTARGETYAVTLADGTKVWLNAQSTLRFPAVFTSSERNVELTGEAYFEVVSNSTKPFRVSVGGSVIEVLGTRFGVSGYLEESDIKTNLLEGKVKVNSNQQSTTLIPGEQAKVSKSGNILVVKNADVEGAIAWKDGVLYFSDESIKTVLRTLARWYDVTIQYEGTVSDDTYKGAIDRNVMLSEVLENIGQMTGMKFEINQRTVIVKP